MALPSPSLEPFASRHVAGGDTARLRRWFLASFALALHALLLLVVL